jgi:hypothetical protein
MIPDDRTSIIPKTRCVELAMGIRTQANVLVVSGTSGYRAGYATDQQPDCRRNPMRITMNSFFLARQMTMNNFFLARQITDWRFGVEADYINVWFPARRITVPIKREVIQQVVEEIK